MWILWKFYPVPQIAKSRFQWLKMPGFVENVTILPDTDNLLNDFRVVSD
jgi:hypothetical protein